MLYTSKHGRYLCCLYFFPKNKPVIINFVKVLSHPYVEVKKLIWWLNMFITVVSTMWTSGQIIYTPVCDNGGRNSLWNIRNRYHSHMVGDPGALNFSCFVCIFRSLFSQSCINGGKVYMAPQWIPDVLYLWMTWTCQQRICMEHNHQLSYLDSTLTMAIGKYVQWCCIYPLRWNHASSVNHVRYRIWGVVETMLKNTHLSPCPLEAAVEPWTHVQFYFLCSCWERLHSDFER